MCLPAGVQQFLAGNGSSALRIYLGSNAWDSCLLGLHRMFGRDATTSPLRPAVLATGNSACWMGSVNQPGGHQSAYNSLWVLNKLLVPLNNNSASTARQRPCSGSACN